MMKYRDLLEKIDNYFSYLTKNYIAVAKINQKGNTLKMTFSGNTGVDNCLKEMEQEGLDKSKYTVQTDGFTVIVTKGQ